MAFTPKTWQDDPSTSTPINATALIDLETRVTSYADGISGPFSVLQPSGDSSGTTDDVNFAAACAALPNGGVIYLVANASSPFYTKNTAGAYTGNGWSPPQQVLAGSGGGPVCIQGVGWPVLMPVGSAVKGFYQHRTADYSTPQDHSPGGYIRDVVVDGTNATGASTGIDTGDTFGAHVRAWVKNFTGTGAIGFNNANRVFFSEKNRYDVQCYNNSIAAKTSQSGVSDSHEYNLYDLVIWAQAANQDGFQVTSGLGGCLVRIRGNMQPTSAPTGTLTGSLTSGSTSVTSLAAGSMAVPANGTVMGVTGSNIPIGTNLTITSSTTATLSAAATGTAAGVTLTSAPTSNCAMLSVTGTHGNIQHAQIWARVEMNNTSSNVNPYSIYSDGVGSITNSSGQFGNATGMSQANMNGAECSFHGMMAASAVPGWPSSNGSTALTSNGGTMTTIPATSVAWNNLGADAIVGVSGGTVSNIRVNSTHGLGVTSGAFFVGAGGFLTLFYTVAPTVVVTQAQGG